MAHQNGHEHEWGHCRDCEYFQIEPNAEVNDWTMGVCIQPELRHFQVRVAGCSGCNHYEHGDHLRAAGSSAEPAKVMLERE